MRFTRRRLTVGKNRSIVASQNVANNRLCGFIVDFFLGGVRFKDFIEQINFSLEFCKRKNRKQNPLKCIQMEIGR